MSRKFDEKSKSKGRTNNPARSKRRNGNKNGFASGKASEDAQKTSDYTNDILWYNIDPNILGSAADIPWSYPIGKEISLGTCTAGSVVKDAKVHTPGLCAIHLAPTAGNASQLQMESPINVSALATYSFIRHMNSGATNYDAPDLMLYIMGVGSFVSYLSFLQRLWDIKNMYYTNNSYLPKEMFELMHVDFDDFVANQKKFAGYFDDLVNRAAAFSIPANMPYFEKAKRVYEGIYTEGTSIRDQIYFYTPYSFHKFDVDAAGAGMLKSKVWDPDIGTTSGSSLMHVDHLYQFGLDLLSNLYGRQDIAIMSGDIAKAYGIEGTYKFQTLQDRMMVPVYDIIILEQMANCTSLGLTDLHELVEGSWDAPLVLDTSITQSTDKSHLVCENVIELPPGDHTTVVAKAMNDIGRMRRAISTITGMTTAELVVESTRMQSTWTCTIPASETTGAQVSVSGEGFIVADVTLKYFENDFFRKTTLGYVNRMICDSPGLIKAFLINVKAFKFLPQTLYIDWDWTFKSIDDISRIGNLDDFTFISADQLDNLNRACLMSTLALQPVNKIR